MPGDAEALEFLEKIEKEAKDRSVARHVEDVLDGILFECEGKPSIQSIHTAHYVTVLSARVRSLPFPYIT